MPSRPTRRISAPLPGPSRARGPTWLRQGPWFGHLGENRTFAPDFHARNDDPAGSEPRYGNLGFRAGHRDVLLPKGGTSSPCRILSPGAGAVARSLVSTVYADQGMAKVSLAPHMPNMMTQAASPAAVALAIKKRSARRRAAPWASSTDRPPAARCERTKKTARP